jgi:hypothetical protein
LKKISLFPSRQELPKNFFKKFIYLFYFILFYFILFFPRPRGRECVRADALLRSRGHTRVHADALSRLRGRLCPRRDLRAHESVSSGSRPRSGEAIGVFTIHPGTSELSIVEVPTVHNTFPVTQFLGANLSLPPWHTLFHIQKVGGVMTVQKLNFFLQKVLGTF